jgi:hypothetical protein
MTLTEVVEEILDKKLADKEYKLDEEERNLIYEEILLTNIEIKHSGYLSRLLEQGIKLLKENNQNKRINNNLYDHAEIIKRLLLINDYQTPIIKPVDEHSETRAKAINYYSKKLICLLTSSYNLIKSKNLREKITEEYIIKGIEQSAQSIKLAETEKTTLEAKLIYVSFTRELCFIKDNEKYIKKSISYLNTLKKQDYTEQNYQKRIRKNIIFFGRLNKKQLNHKTRFKKKNPKKKDYKYFKKH